MSEDKQIVECQNPHCGCVVKVNIALEEYLCPRCHQHIIDPPRKKGKQ